MFRKSYYKTY